MRLFRDLNIHPDNTISSESRLASDISQGILLGPLLFNLYIDEVSIFLFDNNKIKIVRKKQEENLWLSLKNEVSNEYENSEI